MDEKLHDRFGQKSGQGRTEINIFDTEGKQGEQDADRLLFVPGKHEGQGQLVDAATKDFGEGLRDVDRTVGIVALPHIENARDAVDFSEVEVIKAEFTAGEGQDNGIHRSLFDKFRVVISAGMCTVAAADEKNVPDRAGFNRFDKLRGAGEDGSVGKTGRQHVPAVDAAHALVAFIAAKAQGMPDDRGKILMPVFVSFNMRQSLITNDGGRINPILIAGALRHQAVGCKQHRGGDVLEFLLLALPGGSEVSSKVRILVQTGIAVGRKHFAMGINIDTGSFRLFEKLVQVFQIVPGNNDEGTFFDVRVHSCRNGIAEGGRVGGIQKLHAAIVDPAKLHNQGKPFFGGMRFGQLGEPAVKPAVHFCVMKAEPGGVMRIGSHSL